MRRSFMVGLSAAAAVLALTAAEREAKACGGCFHPPAQTASDITDERMLLSVSPTQTTLYDQIQYAGTPAGFAWVLPIHGTVTVGLSADVLFDTVDVLTETTINQPYPNCPPPPPDCGFGGQAGGTAAPPGLSAGADAGAEPGTVTVTKQQNVGPYDTVQLHASDPSALNNWLTQNGFAIPTDVTPVIDQYVTEGFDFLAMKLLPDQGVQSMRPVRVTMPGASLSLPLRMAAVGTGVTVGITIWVVSDGRYEPQNFPFYHIEDSDLIWDFKASISNYTTLRQQNEAKLGGKGWELESSIGINEQTITNVILSGGQYYGGGFGPPVTTPSDPSLDYLPVGDPDAGADAGGYESAGQVRDDDIAALFAGMTGPNVRVTRIRSDISHAAMTTDFLLTASTDQSELSNVRNVTQSVNLQCPVYVNCTVVGSGPVQNPSSGSGSGGGTSTSSGGTTASGSTGGCVASSSSSGSSNVSFGALAGLAGLVVTRLLRGRRRASK